MKEERGRVGEGRKVGKERTIRTLTKWQGTNEDQPKKPQLVISIFVFKSKNNERNQNYYKHFLVQLNEILWKTFFL